MGKNLNYGNLVTRPKKLAFWKLPNGQYHRMEGFTDLSYSQNPKEYSRQYVDEEFERSDIIGYAPSISYSFDRYTGNEVLRDIVKITENEYIADLMKRTIVTVDLTTAGYHSPNKYSASAKMRDYSVIPDSNGDSTDCLTYSGNFKTKGMLIDCVAISDDDWQTIRVEEKINDSTNVDIVITGDGVNGGTISNGTSTHAMGEVTKGTDVTITINADSPTAFITLYKTITNAPWKISSGIGNIFSRNNKISENTTYYVTVENGEEHNSYIIDLTAVDASAQTLSVSAETVSVAKSAKKATAKE
ncbi:MAG: hypothetical protein NC548_54985 [Lachnospiraceae bacterium]|nr:hypothetical protein [Lachnospiraceae bacterium]MCM1233592.1 hypothetical protein [Ruminococcus flavefaciens]